jgi:hypothetical protein
MKVRIALMALAAALAGCASDPLGVKFAPGDRAACAFSQAQGGCMVMTKRQLQLFYDMAFQAGRQYEKGKKDEADKVWDMPWIYDESFHRKGL